MSEWSKEAVLKTVERKFRGFESYFRRHRTSWSILDVDHFPITSPATRYLKDEYALSRGAVGEEAGTGTNIFISAVTYMRLRTFAYNGHNDTADVIMADI